MATISFYAGFMPMVREKGLEVACRYAVDHGFTAVEFLEVPAKPETWLAKSPEEAAEIRRVLQSYGLKVCCFSAAVNFWDRPEDEEGLLQLIPIVAALGCPMLHHMLISWLVYPEGAPSYEEALPKMVEVAAHVAMEAKKAGLTCVYEGQGLYFNGVKGMKPFLEALLQRTDNVGVVGDMGNPLFAGCAPEEFFKAFGPYIKHVHVKDYTIRTFDQNPGEGWLVTESGLHHRYVYEQMPGHGDIRLDECMGILKENGYQGAYSLETVFDEKDEAALKEFFAWMEEREMSLCPGREPSPRGPLASGKGIKLI